MVGEWTVTKPSRSDEVVEADQQLKTANQVRAHFDSIAPKRPIKPIRSETEDFESDSNPPLDVNVDTDTQIPELDKLISLQSDSHVKFTSEKGTVEQDEFVETQYYKQLGSIDKQHHATGTGFIKMVKEGSEDGFDLRLPKGLNGGVGRETVFPCLRSNPATNDWIPSVDADQIVYVSSKPNRSES